LPAAQTVQTITSQTISFRASKGQSEMNRSGSRGYVNSGHGRRCQAF